MSNESKTQTTNFKENNCFENKSEDHCCWEFVFCTSGLMMKELKHLFRKFSRSKSPCQSGQTVMIRQ